MVANIGKSGGVWGTTLFHEDYCSEDFDDDILVEGCNSAYKYHPKLC